MSRLYRLLAIDIDGTLLDSRSRLPDANRAALHRAHEAGLFVCLCTGRSFTETQPVIEQIGLDMDAAICAFGAIVTDARTGRTMHRTPLPRPTAMRLLRFFGEAGRPALVLFDADRTGIDYFLVNGRHNIRAYERWLEVSPTRTRRGDALPDDLPDPLRVSVIEPPETIDRLLREAAAAFPPSEVKANPIFAPNYNFHVFECFAPQVNKWHGIRLLAADHGIDPAHVAAIGDDVNDLEMIRHAGLSAAMGNAKPVVKEAACLQTATNDEAGVAHFIDRLLAGDVPPPRRV